MDPDITRLPEPDADEPGPGYARQARGTGPQATSAGPVRIEQLCRRVCYDRCVSAVIRPGG